MQPYYFTLMIDNQLFKKFISSYFKIKKGKRRGVKFTVIKGVDRNIQLPFQKESPVPQTVTRKSLALGF